MGRHRQATASQGNTMEQYTTPTPLHQCQTHIGGPGEVLGTPATAEEPSRDELLAAIQGFRVALEGKIEMVAVEVNLLRADLCKVSDKVKVAEGSIVDLQTEQDGTMAVVVPELAAELTVASDQGVEMISVDI
ncbi:hypothetical protein NDU88_006369 [Pleurodeles waltl]|uniref:Uncharacterized protein n=1 Tax=Pleurodeles waltl TaxID=8319 RepID=A0AAV7TWP2_PLEWA|nr:hypothetical protein NDU88_006369 [Pleurodeles waltl]